MTKTKILISSMLTITLLNSCEREEIKPTINTAPVFEEIEYEKTENVFNEKKYPILDDALFKQTPIDSIFKEKIEALNQAASEKL